MTNTDVRDERLEIEQPIEGQTVATALWHAATYHDAPALSGRLPEGDWSTRTWGEVREEVLAVAAGLASLGLRPRDTVAIMAPNCPEHVLADQGVVHAGGVPFTVYATFAPDQVEFVARHAGARIAIVHGHEELARWSPVLNRLPALEHVIVIDPDSCPAGDRFLSYPDLVARGRAARAAEPGTIDRLWQQLTADDPVTLLYTSGTTGKPKGVLLTHHNVLYKAESWRRNVGLGPHPVSVSYLPYAHIAERVNGMYVPIHLAGHVYFCSSLPDFPDVLAQVRPHSLTAVPRVWEKLQARLGEHLEHNDRAASVESVQQASDLARSYLAACEDGAQPTAQLEQQYRRAEQEVLMPLRRVIGLDRSQWCASSAARAPESVLDFFAGLGIRITSVYGMTETTGGVTVNRLESFRTGTVGQVITGCQATTAPDGELLVRGPLVTPGYHDDPVATAAFFDEQGWAHTGDLASIDEDGYISIVGRKKELIVTSGGENVAPAAIEDLLRGHQVVAQAMACGDGRRYITALISVDPEMAAGPVIEVESEVADAVAAANARLARVQQIKKWRIVPGEWSVDGGELTPTLKLRREVVERNHAELIEQMYASDPAASEATQ